MLQTSSQTVNEFTLLRILYVSILLLSTVLCTVPSWATPQPQYRFQHIDSLNGLHQNTIYSLLESQSGMLWVGTQDGLHLYNGNDFTLFLPNVNDPNSISDSFITDILQQGNSLWLGTFSGGLNRLDLRNRTFQHFGVAQGLPKTRIRRLALMNQQLWIATQNGLFVLNPQQAKVHRVEIPNTTAPVVNNILTLADDQLLISTETQGTYLYQQGAFTQFLLPSMEQRIDSMRIAADNAIWLATGAQLWRYSPQLASPKLIYQLLDPQKRIRDFVFDHKGGIWLGGSSTGLVHLFNQQPSGPSQVIRYSPYVQDGLSSNDISRLFLDKQGNLWIGSSYSGLNRINVDRQYFSHIYNDIDPFNLQRFNNIRAITRVDNGNMYIGTNDAGLFKLDTNGKFHSLNYLFVNALSEQQDPLHTRVFAISKDKQQRLWLATSQGFACLTATDALSFIPMLPGMGVVRSVLAQDNFVWLSSGANLYRYDIAAKLIAAIPLPYSAVNKTVQQQQTILNLRETASGLWVMTMDGVYLIPKSAGAITYIAGSKLAQPFVRDVLEQANGKVWLATHGGISILHNGTITNLTTDDGLPNNTIYALESDEQGNVWFSSNAGISKFNVTNQQVITFNENEGIQALEFNGGVRWKDKDNSIWFGGINGLNHFQPAEIPNQRADKEVALASYRIGDDIIPFYRIQDVIDITLPYSTELLNFKVTPTDFSYPGHHQYSFLLNGLDNNWHPFESMNEISYTAIPSGHYQLVVRHRLDGSATYNEQVLANITINAPFYRTTWAYAMYAFYLLILIIFTTRHFIRKWKKERAIQTQINASRERFKLALWGSGDRLWDWHLASDIITITQLSQEDELAQEMDHQQYLALIHPDDRPVVQKALTDYLAERTAYYEAEYRIFSPEGQWEWGIERGKVSERDKQNYPIRMAGTYTNISVRKQQEDQLKLSYQVLESMNEAVVICDLEYRIISVNPAFSDTTGYQDSEIEGKYCLALTRGLYQMSEYRTIENELLKARHWRGEMRLRKANGKSMLVWLEINQVLDSKGEASHLVMVFTDISDRKKAEEDLRLLANYDPLTGLPNRTLFKERLKHALEQAQRNGTKVALLFLDLDRFKNINDSKGHHVGDQLLQAVGKRLAGVIRAGDTVARIGGDEFTIILEGIVKSKAATVIAEKIIDVLDQPFELDHTTLDITTSIGISLSPDDTEDSQELLKYADTAMYHAKSMGRNNFQFYTAHMNVSAVRHLQLETGLKQAISKQELFVVYQPKFCVNTGKVMGLEALMRWHSEELGPVSPAEFIPLAEETGLITSLGSWLLDHVCQQIIDWQQQGTPIVPIAINLSARQLQLSIIDEIEQTLAHYQLPASLLEIELTESAVMKHPQQSIAILNRLEQLGLSLAVDDFGTGYSSLAYLKRFPINTLKIDREFVRDISDDPDDAAITSAIIALAHSLELLVVAEGVESNEQLQFLATQGCDQIQGFLLSKPLTAEKCAALLVEKN